MHIFHILVYISILCNYNLNQESYVVKISLEERNVI